MNLVSKKNFLLVLAAILVVALGIMALESKKKIEKGTPFGSLQTYESEIMQIEEQSASDEIEDIEADLKSTEVDSLDAELDDFEEELAL